jgi:hypothetical protein
MMFVVRNTFSAVLHSLPTVLHSLQTVYAFSYQRNEKHFKQPVSSFETVN